LQETAQSQAQLCPSAANESTALGHRFASEKELATYLLRTVFGRKKAFTEGTSVQDWLYLHPNKLSSIRELRESILK
jgi:hypothetical protein